MMTDENEDLAGLGTAMDAVRCAERGEITKDQLGAILDVWDFEPKHRTSGLVDDWEPRPNSFEVVEYAFIIDLIDEHTYLQIYERARRASNGQ